MIILQNSKEKAKERKKLRLDFTPSQWGMLMGIMFRFQKDATEAQKKMIDDLMKEVQAI